MPKASPLQPSFSAGEFSPRLYGRTDSERYKTGLATCLNYLPTIEGPIIRRPGTRYSGFDVKNPSSPPVLIPFELSATDSYVLEFGDGYVRFFKNGGQVVTINSSVALNAGDWKAYAESQTGFIGANLDFAGTPFVVDGNAPSILGPLGTGSSAPIGSAFEMSSPFNSSDVKKLNYSMQAGELYLTCGRLPPYKLTRQNPYAWTMAAQHPLLDGPYLPFNTEAETGDRFNVALQITVTGTSAVGNKFVTTSVETRPKLVISNADARWLSNSSAVVVAMSTVLSHNFYVGQPLVVDASGAPGGGMTWGAVNNRLSGRVHSVQNERSLWMYANEHLTSGPPAGGANGSTFVMPALVEAECYNRLLAISVAGKRFWGTAGIIASSAYRTASFNVYESPITTSVGVSSWQLGTYFTNSTAGDLGHFPRYNTFHQNRWALSGYDRRPQEIVASVTGEFTDLRTSNSSYVTADNNALQFKIVSKQPSDIQWIASDANGLLAGGYSSEFKISPSSNSQALVPSNINATETSYFGSVNIPAIKAGNAVLYVQKSNRKVRELNYFYQVNTYRSTDLSELSDHITAPKIVAMTNQNETIPAVWCLRSDGQLISMIYGRDDESLKAGWARHRLGGQSDSGGTAPQVLSMAVIAGSSGSFDQMWMCTRRFINGTSVVNIEYLTKPYEKESTQIEDAFQVDCGATYDMPIAISMVTTAGSAIVTAAAHSFVDGDQVQIAKVVGMNTSVSDINGVIFNSNLVNYNVYRVGSTSANAFFLQDVNNGSSYIDSRGYSVYVSGGEARKLINNLSGLTWLKNETVAILADGRIHPNTQVNSAGVLALSFSAAKVQIGLPYNSDAKTLRLDAGSADGSAIGKLRRSSKAAFQLYNVGEMAVGPSFEKLTPLSDVESFKADNAMADEAPPLFNGIAREPLESEYDFDSQICIRQSAPLPGMIQSITTIMDESDV